MHEPELRFEPLSAHPERIATLAAWFEAEWPAYYGPAGRADARQDLLAYAHADALPFGLVALIRAPAAVHAEVPCGFVAIKTERFATHPQLYPWVGAAVVPAGLRGQGIGRQLFSALESHAQRLGFRQLYSATRTAHSLLLRCGWQHIDTALHEGESIGIYQRTLSDTP